MAETLLFSTTRVSTFRGRQLLTAATGFFFERDGALYLVTCRHVLHDAASGHFPDRAEIVLHVDRQNLARTTGFSIPLYSQGEAVWRQGSDSSGEVDIAAVPLQRDAFPPDAVFSAFGPEHLLHDLGEVQLGEQLLVVGFPLSFFDTMHHLPVARHAIVASAFGVRFQGQGYFLTDARLHRGTSGAPVVSRGEGLGPVPWRLLGVHSAQMDMGDRDGAQDEILGLNSAWYADFILALTGRDAPPNASEMGPRPVRRGGP